ncbi:MAG: hypothetical protein KA142_10025 [Chromatiaceae bacterium]|nr:hypothetical protein [Chromatiaceae bacterium]
MPSTALRPGSTRRFFSKSPPPAPKASSRASRERSPLKITHVPTDKGKAFTDRCCATGQREPTGDHRFDPVGAAHAIAHRLITPRHPQTNGRVECCNDRVAEVLATHRCHSSEHLEDTLIR